MNWKSIRLELAGTKGFPEGSASRCYLLRLPLDEHGLIDGDTVEDAPDQATVRRFWPSEPDRIGHVVPVQGGWGFFYESTGTEEEDLFPVATHVFHVGNCIMVTEPDGRQLPYRVARVEALRRAVPRTSPLNAAYL
jgi:hypothetical protein